MDVRIAHTQQKYEKLQSMTKINKKHNKTEFIY